MPIVLRVDPETPDPAAIARAADVLKRGGLVAMPTETVYGLAARGLHSADVARIFEAKGRPTTHPLILHVDSEAMARGLAAPWTERASRFAAVFWPGPLTLVVPRAAHVPDAVTGGLATVALRVPAHPVARALVTAVGEALAAPSANAHMHISPTTAAHVVRSLGERVDLVLDAGPCTHGIESTVLDLAGEIPRVLRPGATSLEQLRAVDPAVAYAVIKASEGAARASPGLASKHYAPHAAVVLAPRSAFIDAVQEGIGSGKRTASIVWSRESEDEVARVAAGLVFLAVLPADPEGYARGLFAAFFDADAARAEILVVEALPDEPAFLAVLDRLERARAT